MSVDEGNVSRSRRAFDRVDRQARARRIWGTMLVVLAIFALAAGYGWWRAREPAHDATPSWSPDGRSIVFAAGDGEPASFDIFIMNADGTGRRRLTIDSTRDSHPAISPDGTRIVFESDRMGNPDIYVMDVTGRNVRQLTHDPAADRMPAWSPDGRQIAFVSSRGGTADLYRMDADGGVVERLSSGQAHASPAFSPDGRELAVEIDRDVWIVDLATRAKRRLTFAPQNGMHPAWSSDGTRLAFVSSRRGSTDIFTTGRDGADTRLLVTMATADAIDPGWSPDGSRMVFVMTPTTGEHQAPAIYTIDLASERLTRLSR